MGFKHDYIDERQKYCFVLVHVDWIVDTDNHFTGEKDFNLTARLWDLVAFTNKEDKQAFIDNFNSADYKPWNRTKRSFGRDANIIKIHSYKVRHCESVTLRHVGYTAEKSRAIRILNKKQSD